MVVPCPYCQHRIEPNRPQSGRYKARCPRCARPFVLSVPADPDADMTALPFTADTPVGGPVPDARTPPRTFPRVSARTSVGGVDLGALPSADSETGRHSQETPRPITRPAPRPKTPVRRNLPDPPAADPGPPPIPGYRIEGVIGTGGMGTVYLGRQLSLDRPVAIKVMSRKWADDPVFVARFTREAYAAALLCHPNVVQIYDIGDTAGTKFFSMEYVPGRTLAEVVRTGGRLDPETAVGYVLQAARGLKHAHDRGMIHRDVKPDNLLLNNQGVVKVADLGLVKTPDVTRDLDESLDLTESGLATLPANMTGHRMALGTPAYMAPEQCRDAAAVDHRADVYSLGCTLYALVTGRQPFDGNTAVELMTKHAYEPLVPPEVIVSRLPKELSAVIQTMMAKDPADRFQDMGEVIRTLEGWLGIHHAGTFSPRDDQIEKVEACVRAFNAAPAAVVRERVVTGFLSACSLLTLMLVFFGKLGWAFGLGGVVIQAALAYFVLNGVARKTYLFRRVRQLLFGLTAGDWLVLAAGVALFAVFLWSLDLLGVWLAGGLIGLGLAAALRFGLDRAVDRQRKRPVEETEKLLRVMRLTGVDEDDLRQFVAKHAGRHWEEFFEAVFGYEAKLATRAVLLRGGSAGVREKFAPWREPLVYLIDRAEVSRKESRERALLERVERERLVAAGLDRETAWNKAAATATALVEQANAIRWAEAHRRGSGLVGSAPDLPPDVHALLAQASGRFPRLPDEPPPPQLPGVVRALLGPVVRAGLAALLLAGFGLWVVQNRAVLVPGYAAEGVAAEPTPLAIPGVPAVVTGWCDTANPGWAAILVLASLFYRGERMSAMVLFGAAVAVLGHKLGIQTVEPFRDYHVSLMLGVAFALVGYRRGWRP